MESLRKRKGESRLEVGDGREEKGKEKLIRRGSLGKEFKEID